MLKRYAAAFAVIAQFFCPMMVRAASTDAARIAGDLKVDGIHFTEDNSVIRKLADLISPWTLLNGNLYYLNGNVGIGTMTPGAPLGVNGNAIVSGNLTTGSLTTSGQITSTVQTGTAPLAASSTTLVPNLNAEMVGGQTLADLDIRFGSPSTPNPNLKQISTLRWDQVRGGSMAVTVGYNPNALIFDGSSIWVANRGSNSVMKINPASGVVSDPISVGIQPASLAFDGFHIWVANYYSGTVTKINPFTNKVILTITVGTNPESLVYDGSCVWVGNNGDGTVSKIDPHSNEVIATITIGGNLKALAFDGTYIWVGYPVTKIDPINNTIVGTQLYPFTPTALAFDGTNMWGAGSTNLVQKVGSNSGIQVGNTPRALVYDGINLWVANYNDNTVQKINPTTGTVSPPITVSSVYPTGFPTSMAFDGANMWVANSAPGATLVYKLANAGVSVGEQTIGTAQLTDNAVTTSTIANGAVTASKLASPLNLPINGLTVGTTQLVVTGNKVGIGTALPTAELDVNGYIRTTDKDLLLRGDSNHGIGWYGSGKLYSGINIDGPVVYGFGGGGLGVRGVVALTWDSAQNLHAWKNVHVDGSLDVSGTLSKGSGSFKIDHPLDPKNKYLLHSFVESPDMMNIYNGNVTTGADGFATVEMPVWFEALNREFRYQLTVIDETDSVSFVQAKVVKGVTGNSFRIRTSEPNTLVSWQVTGIRKDAYAEANRIKVEEEKPESEKGACIHQEACR